MIKTEPSNLELPEDVDTLRQMVMHLLADVDDLNKQLAWYKRYVFGRRSERIDPSQLRMFEEPAGQEQPYAEEMQQAACVSVSGKRNGNHKGRRPLPAELPRERIEHHPPKEQLVCSGCGHPKEIIGQEITEQLDYVPASFVVRQHIRYKYACRQCQEGVCIADLPAFAIEKGRPGSGLLAHVLTSKYADHLPLHRMEGIIARHGIDLGRSTLCDWVGSCAELLWPIVAEIKRQILSSAKIHTDDTSVPVQIRGRKKTRKGYLWAYIGQGNNVVFDYTPTRCRDGPIEFLGDYGGFVQADAYQGYDKLFAKGKCTEVGCWAHARRKFFDAKDSDPGRAYQMLALIGKLYDVERQAKEEGLDTADIVKLRQKSSKPVLEQIDSYLEGWSGQVLPKSPVGKAVGYALGQWEALNRYVDHGILSIDNNLAERVLRMVVIGRKNWLFAGSDNGGKRAAVIYSLVASCKLCGIDPFAYLRDVIDRVSTHPAKEISQLIPSNWKALHASPETGQASSNT
jgi:transposase